MMMNTLFLNLQKALLFAGAELHLPQAPWHLSPKAAYLAPEALHLATYSSLHCTFRSDISPKNLVQPISIVLPAITINQDGA